MPVAALMAGAAARMSATSWTVSALLGALLGMTFRIAVSPAALNTAGATNSTSSSARDVARHRLRGGLGVRDAGCVEHDGQGAVEARAEARGEQVVGLALGRGLARRRCRRAGPRRRSRAGRAMTTSSATAPPGRAAAGAR